MDKLRDLAQALLSACQDELIANTSHADTVGVLEDAAREALAMPGTLPDMSAVLPPAELRVLRALAMGLSNREIAAHLNVARGTIKNQVSSVMDKLGCKSRVEAVLFYYGLHPRQLMTNMDLSA